MGGKGEADEDDLYESMDWLLVRQDRIEKKLAARHYSEGSLVLYGVTSSYYEGHTCSLARYGHDRDGKNGRPIIVYGLMTDGEGRPVAVEAYPGDTGDPSTVPGAEKLRKRFGMSRLVLVGDRGMVTQTQIEKLRAYPGLGWISALRADGIRKLAKGGFVQMSLFDQKDLAEIYCPEYSSERLIAFCHRQFPDEMTGGVQPDRVVIQRQFPNLRWSGFHLVLLSAHIRVARFQPSSRRAVFSVAELGWFSA